MHEGMSHARWVTLLSCASSTDWSYPFYDPPPCIRSQASGCLTTTPASRGPRGTGFRSTHGHPYERPGLLRTSQQLGSRGAGDAKRDRADEPEAVAGREVGDDPRMSRARAPARAFGAGIDGVRNEMQYSMHECMYVCMMSLNWDRLDTQIK